MFIYDNVVQCSTIFWALFGTLFDLAPANKVREGKKCVVVQKLQPKECIFPLANRCHSSPSNLELCCLGQHAAATASKQAISSFIHFSPLSLLSPSFLLSLLSLSLSLSDPIFCPRAFLQREDIEGVRPRDIEAKNPPLTSQQYTIK